MSDKVLRKMFLGFMQIHILHHANKEPFYGLWMIDELKSHGYEISAGTIYPMLHNMELDGLLTAKEKNIDGKLRKYYSITDRGLRVLRESQIKASELLKELEE